MAQITFTQFQSKYKYQTHLSQGGFGRVCQIIEKGTENKYALKKLEIKSIQQLNQAKNEINLMRKLSKYQVVRIIAYYIVQINNIYSDKLYEVGIVMERATGSLFQLLKQNLAAISQNQAIRLLSTMVAILLKCQNQNIAHRDIKPANILFFQNNNQFQWKLADFGLAFEPTNNKTKNCFVGTYQYASPNLKKKFKYPKLNIKLNCFKDDVYSLGITILQVLTGKAKYNPQNLQQNKRKIENKKLLKILQLMLQEQQQKRPCFKDLQKLLYSSFPQICNIQDNEQKQNIQINEKVENKELEIKQTEGRKQQKIVQIQGKHQQQPKTQIIKYQQPEIKVINLGQPIYSLVILQEKVICGSENGDIIVINEDSLIRIKDFYKNIVTQLSKDNNENIWAAGMDSKIYIIPKQSLLKSIIQATNQPQNKQKIQLAISKQKIQNIRQVKISPQIKTKAGVSSLVVQDQTHFCVGYYDGWVYIKWGQLQFKQKLHRAPVTGFSFNKQRVISCSIDKFVKIIQIEQEQLKLSHRTFSASQGIINLKNHQNQKQPKIQVLTIDGEIILFNMQLQKKQTKKIQKNQYFCSTFIRDKLYAVSANGYLFIQQEEVVKIETKGANCIQVADEGEIVIGSFDGIVSMLKL